MTSSLDLIRGRQVVSTLTNQSGGPVIAGDVVVVDTAHDESFITTTTASYNASQVGIALDSIAAAASGRILLQGYAPLVNVSASATRAYYLFTHTVAKQATSSASFAAGAFGQVLKAGTTPSAFIFPPALSSTAGITRSGSTTGDHLAVWNGSNADSLKDGGAAPAALASGRATRTAGDLTTTSTSMVDATSLTVTITTGARRCLVSFIGAAKVNATDTAIFDLAIDGTLIGGTYGTSLVQSVSGTTNVGFTYLTDALTAASHTFKIQWKSVGGQQATLYASTGVTPAILSVVELNT